MTWQILEGDCLALMPTLADASVDAIVTDPPYGLGFMGRAWDALPPGLPWAQECLRVLKPGGHLLAFGGTRTSHRLVCAVEDAGFQIRDTIAWMYGSGFPKSLNLAGEHEGWGTALKPAHEPIVVARKPLAGTVAANLLAHGTGALNVDGCRVPGPVGENWSNTVGSGAGRETANTDGPAFGNGLGGVVAAPHDAGRWPANVVLDEEAAALLDEQTGELASGTHRPDEQRTASGGNGNTHGAMAGVVGAWHGDTGGASRFFYCAKSSPAERNLGGKNTHPTVKPVALMQWLVRLVTPPGGLVLDPFAGSGTTGVACLREGFSFVGVEREAEYVAIARARIVGDCPLHNTGLEVAA